MSLVSEEYGMFLDGTFHTSGGVFSVEDPATGDTIATVASGNADDVGTAIESAINAQREWEALDPQDRGTILQDVATAVEAAEDQIAEIVTQENGRPIGQSKAIAGGTSNYIAYFADLADKIEGESIPVPGERHAFTRREPLGVSAQILPWNAPVLLCARGVGPALAAGNAVVAKPAPEAPLGILELARTMSEAGLPDGLFNVVPGGGETGEALSTDPRIDEVTFTGSVPTGKRVGRAAVDNLVPMALELGGKSPAIVFPDADIEAAVDGAIHAITMMSGQVCFATTRLFVHEDVYEEFRSSLLEAVDQIEIGPGRDNPDLGPVISGEALSNIETYVTEAIANGATAISGGSRLDRKGHFFEPTIIEGAADDAPISCEEVFGPVVNLYEFSTEEEAIRRGNDTDYGLYATVWTDSVGRAHRVANALEAGSVMVNQYSGSTPATPFGGYKQSGIGREKGKQALDHYTQLKTVNIDIS